MPRLTHNLGCFIACCVRIISPLIQHAFVTPVGSLYRACNTNANLWAFFVMGLTPTQSSYSAAEIPPQSPKFTAPLMGHICTQK